MTILFDGDSNVANYVGVPKTYADLIGEGLNHSVLNVATPGYYASGVLVRMPSNAAQNPNHIFVNVGTNDAASSAQNGTSVDILVPEYKNTMNQIISASESIPITIMSPCRSLSPATNSRLVCMTNMLRDLCRSRNVNFFDVFGLMDHQASLLSEAAFRSAWMHPASADLYHIVGGHALIASAFLKTQVGVLSVSEAPSSDGMIPQNVGTPIGDMTSGGGLTSAFNGIKNVSSANCAKKANTSVTSYIGKYYDEAKTIKGFKYWGSNDLGVSQGNNTISLQCWTKASEPAPTSDIKGVYIGGFNNVSDSTEAFEHINLPPTLAKYVWIRVISTDELANKFCAEVEFYE